MTNDNHDDWRPVLQIVHVTDMHVKEMTSANPLTPLMGMSRVVHRAVMRSIERKGNSKWDEGTQGHYPAAPVSFRRFLKRYLARDAVWSEVPSWLVDTGDRSAYGDMGSIEAGEGFLSMWQEALHGCPVRTIYGNHDAWPRTFPLAVGASNVGEHRGLVCSRPGWQAQEWLTKPLTVALPGNASIKLYALDSVCWGRTKNSLAVGEVAQESLSMLADQLREDTAQLPGLRIVALHHPLAFPWYRQETKVLGIFPAMKLLQAESRIERLRNDVNDPPALGPLAHLFLSGHTHIAHPAPGSLLPSVTSVSQATLGPYQLQMVGGSLMLNKHRRQTAGTASSVDRADAMYDPSTVLARNCQAQILRFRACEQRPGMLEMVRIPIFSENGSLYEEGDPDGTLLSYAT